MIWIVNFPLPPSVNEHLIPVVSNKYAIDRRGKLYQKAHVIKSKSHRQYLLDCKAWATYHNVSFGKIKNQIQGMLAVARQNRTPFCLRVDHYFAFHHPRLWTSTGLVEQIDADNPLKPCRDALADILGIDDKHFFGGYFEKVSTHSKELECSILRISQITPRTLDQIKDLIRTETTGSS